MAEYSWQRHLIRNGTYADWVDRGRLRPTHRQWASYLREVADRAQAEIVPGEVVGLEATRTGGGCRSSRGRRSGPTASSSPARAPPIRVAGQPQRILGCSTAVATGWRSGGRRRDCQERVCDRQRRDGGLGGDQPAYGGAQALDGRRRDKPRRSLLEGGELRRESLLLRSRRLAGARRIAPARVHRSDRPRRLLPASRGDPHARRAGTGRCLAAPWQSRPANNRLSSRSSTAVSGSASPMTWLSSRSASTRAGSPACSARGAAPAGRSASRGRPRAPDRCRSVGRRPEPADSPAAAGRAGAGARLSQSQLPGPAGRPRAAPLRRRDGAGSPLTRKGGTLSATPEEVSRRGSDCVRRMVVIPVMLAERLAAQANQAWSVRQRPAGRIRRDRPATRRSRRLSVGRRAPLWTSEGPSACVLIDSYHEAGDAALAAAVTSCRNCRILRFVRLREKHAIRPV